MIRIFSLILLCLPVAVQAQGYRNCTDRQEIVGNLAEKYGETRQNIGITSAGYMMETYASADTGTWTTIVTIPNGPACVAASGQSFESVTELLPLQDDPT